MIAHRAALTWPFALVTEIYSSAVLSRKGITLAFARRSTRMAAHCTTCTWPRHHRSMQDKRGTCVGGPILASPTDWSSDGKQDGQTGRLAYQAPPCTSQIWPLWEINLTSVESWNISWRITKPPGTSALIILNSSNQMDDRKQKGSSMDLLDDCHSPTDR